MKRMMSFLLLLVMLCFVVPHASAPAKTDDELYPCDPTPFMIRRCELQGGTFDFAKCRCVLP